MEQTNNIIAAKAIMKHTLTYSPPRWQSVSEPCSRSCWDCVGRAAICFAPQYVVCIGYTTLLAAYVVENMFLIRQRFTHPSEHGLGFVELWLFAKQYIRNASIVSGSD